jgi:hypothetical protein
MAVCSISVVNHSKILHSNFTECASYGYLNSNVRQSMDEKDLRHDNYSRRGKTTLNPDVYEQVGIAHDPNVHDVFTVTINEVPYSRYFLITRRRTETSLTEKLTAVKTGGRQLRKPRNL